jgi:hypothetical protein
VQLGLSWKDRVTGDFRAVFAANVNDGAGLWRAADWKRAVQTVYGEAGRGWRYGDRHGPFQ